MASIVPVQELYKHLWETHQSEALQCLVTCIECTADATKWNKYFERLIELLADDAKGMILLMDILQDVKRFNSLH